MDKGPPVRRGPVLTPCFGDAVALVRELRGPASTERGKKPLVVCAGSFLSSDRACKRCVVERCVIRHSHGDKSLLSPSTSGNGTPSIIKRHACNGDTTTDEWAASMPT